MKRVMLYTAFILATLAVIYLLWQFKFILLLFLLSLIVAATIRPGVDWLVEKGLPKAVAQLVLYGLGTVGLLLGLFLLGSLFLQELHALINWAVIELEAWHQRWQIGAAWQQTVIMALPLPLPVSDGIELDQILPVVLNVTAGLAGLAGGFVLLISMSIYWSTDQYRFERLWLSLLPARQRMYARDGWRELEANIGRYMRIQLVQAVLVAVLLAGGALVARVEFPIFLAIFGALASFVPLAGGLITAVVALVTGSAVGVWTGVGIALYTLLVMSGLELFVRRRLWSRQKRRSYMLSVVVIIPLVISFGFLGLLIAPPLTVALEALIRQAYESRLSRAQSTGEYTELESRYRMLNEEFQRQDEAIITPDLKSLSQRLAALLAESRPAQS